MHSEPRQAFFLPHLRPGLRLLDVGCGPGTITLGLAAAVAPGEVVGLDLRPEVVAQARDAAAERGGCVRTQTRAGGTGRTLVA